MLAGPEDQRVEEADEGLDVVVVGLARSGAGARRQRQRGGSRRQAARRRRRGGQRQKAGKKEKVKAMDLKDRNFRKQIT